MHQGESGDVPVAHQSPDAVPFSVCARPGRLFLVSGVSGSGKTSLVQAACERLGAAAPRRVVTYTTRAPRPGERPGIDYHFISQQEFTQKVRECFFIEYSTAYGACYGSPMSVLDDVARGISYCLVVDRDGISSIKSLYPQAIAILIRVSDLEELKKRLVLRGQDSEKRVQERLALAAVEMAHERAYTLYNYSILNDVFERALEELVTIFSDERQKPA